MRRTAMRDGALNYEYDLLLVVIYLLCRDNTVYAHGGTTLLR